MVQTIKCNYLPEKEDRGYEALTGKMNVELYEKDAATRALNPKKKAKIEERKLEYMEKFISLCKANDIKLILCFSPYYHTTLSEGVSMIQKMAVQYGVPFYEFVSDNTFDDAYLFNDEMHLNDEGAKKYTELIVSKIYE